MATISNTPRPGYVWDATDNCWYPIGTGPHSHADYITAGSAINPNIVDAKGDIIAATAADTVARLAVGANDTVLTADSSTATGLKWAAPAAGGMTLLSTTTLSGTSTTISNISQDYTNLQVVIHSVDINTAPAVLRVAPNGTTNITSYKQDTSTSTRNTVQNAHLRLTSSGSTIVNDNLLNAWVFTIHNYTSSFYKVINGAGAFQDDAGNSWSNHFGGAIRTTSAVTSLVIDNDNGYSFGAGTVLLYGVK